MTAPVHLQRIKLEGFRSIRAMDLVLTPLNVLVGANGAGKSNFISFFKFMNRLLDRQLQLHVSADLNGANRTLFFGGRTTSKLFVDLDFSEANYQIELRPSTGDKLIYSSERIAAHGSQNSIDLASPGDLESQLIPSLEAAVSPLGVLSVDSVRAEHRMYVCLSNCVVYHFHDTGNHAQVKKSYSIFANTHLMAHGENLASFLYGIQQTHRSAYDRIVRVIQRVAPFFHDFVFELETNDLIRLRWKHKGSDDYFDATMLSDGTLRFICLAALLLQPKPPALIVLDEPELGLHPFALQLLAALMRSASTHTQIIAATQSVTLANQFGWQDLVVVDQVDNASVFRRLQESEVVHWLEQYSVGDLWEKNLLGGTPE